MTTIKGVGQVLCYDVRDVVRRIQSDFYELHKDPETYVKITEQLPEHRVTHVLNLIARDVAYFAKSGDKYIGIYQDFAALKEALHQVDILGANGSPRQKGEAFGQVFLATAKFLARAPDPLNRYVLTFEAFGNAFGNIAEMLSGSGKVTRSMDMSVNDYWRMTRNIAADPNMKVGQRRGR